MACGTGRRLGLPDQEESLRRGGRPVDVLDKLRRRVGVAEARVDGDVGVHIEQPAERHELGFTRPPGAGNAKSQGLESLVQSLQSKVHCP